MKKSCRRHLAMITLPIWLDFPLKTVLQVTALTLVSRVPQRVFACARGGELVWNDAPALPYRWLTSRSHHRYLVARVTSERTILTAHFAQKQMPFTHEFVLTLFLLNKYAAPVTWNSFLGFFLGWIDLMPKDYRLFLSFFFTCF